MTVAHPAVSVIVPVRHDLDGLRELIASIGSQTLGRDRLELVVGADGTPEESIAAVDAPDWVRIVWGPRATSYAARNRAAAAASGAVLAFCDSDCLPEPTWLEHGLAAVRDADLVAGEIRFAAPTIPTAWSLLTVDAFLDQEENVRRSRAVTANLLVRRPVFDALGGFDESLPSGGDWDFAERAVRSGARLQLASAARVRHPTIDDRRSFLRKLRTINRCAFVRSGMSRRRRDLVGLLTLVPVIGVALTRRHNGRPALGLSRRRLDASGLAPGRLDELRALALLYSVMAYTVGVARVRGWREGRGLARASRGRGDAIPPAPAATPERAPHRVSP